MTTNANYFRGMVINNTGADIRDCGIEQVIRECNGNPLPEELADLFKVEVVYVGAERRLLVHFIGD